MGEPLLPYPGANGGGTCGGGSGGARLVYPGGLGLGGRSGSSFVRLSDTVADGREKEGVLRKDKNGREGFDCFRGD
jgi:hypothetical protein